jgi:hypothetical protein
MFGAILFQMMTLLENVAENFGAIFRENQFHVNKVYTRWSASIKQQDRR